MPTNRSVRFFLTTAVVVRLETDKRMQFRIGLWAESVHAAIFTAFEM